MPLTDNTLALQSGFQIGTGWAAQRQHNRQQGFDNSLRTKQAQDHLKVAFGEATVLDERGNVDVVASAAKQKQVADAAGVNKAQGYIAGATDWRDEAAAPPPQQFSTPMEPGDPGYTTVPGPDGSPMKVRTPGAQMMPDPESYPAGPPNQAQPPTAVPAPGPQNQINDVLNRLPPNIRNNPDALSGFVTGLATSEQRRLKREAEIRAEAQKIVGSQEKMKQIEALIQGRKDTATQNNDTKKTIAADNITGRKDVAVLNTDTRKAITADSITGRKDVAELNIAGRDALADKNIDARSENTDKLIAGRVTVAGMKLSGAGGEPKLNTADNVAVKKLEEDVVTKERIAGAIDANIAQLTNDKTDPYVRRQAGLSILKTLNSAEGKDAVGAEEAKRLGQFLQYQINPIEVLKTGRVFGTDMPRFIQQITLKRDELKGRAETGRSTIKGIYSKYGYNPENPRGNAAAPGGKVVDADIARDFLLKAGGDKNMARKLATDAGYTIP